MQPDARAALRTILSRIMDDVDPDKHSWAEREKYSRVRRQMLCLRFAL
ncbi:hypothetical protein JHL21_12360 [Devosia sp. WQ 349]|nr:hypothetical protein [Devosia sp. WQ 349K1]